MNIGDKLYKNNAEQLSKYSEYVIWCSNNKAYIVDKGEYYEIVELPKPKELSEEEKNKIIAIQTKGKLFYSVIYSVMDIFNGKDIKNAQNEYQAALTAIEDCVAMYIPEIFPIWSANAVKYEKDQRIQYNGVLYKVLTEHTSQDSWKPDITPSLFVKVIDSINGEIPEWQQPSADNAYKKGDKVRYKGRIYESLIDNNVWSPEGYPDGWKDITDEV